MSQATTCAKLMSLGVPKETASNVIKTLDGWVANNGIEWTIDHLKDIKQVFLGKLAGTSMPTKTWVKLRRDGYPAGPLTATFLRQKKVTPRRLSQVLTTLTAHSMYLAPQCTEKQREKFFGSMTSTDVRGLNSKLKIIPRLIKSDVEPYTRLKPFMAHCTSDVRRAPGPGLKTCPESDYLSILQHAVDSASIFGLVHTHKKVSERVLPYDDYMFRCMRNYKEMRFTTESLLYDNFGVISGIQEPGFKLRAVANPSRIVQAMLEPLKDLVMSHLKLLPTDHTHDQEAAIPKIQEMLKSGETVHSVDLSDATNLFPLPLQVDLLYKMCPPRYHEFIQIFDEVAKGNWMTKLRGKPELVSFSRGQPLGLGPSFGVFALAHNTLLEGLCIKLSLKPEDHFVVLGDDVVIRGDKLNRLYRESLNNLGCKVSQSKTISSTQLAEFAGWVVLRDMKAKGFKWKDVSDHSFLDMVKNLGPKAQGFLHKWQKDVIKVLAPVPPCIGGLGWSDGRPLHEVFEFPVVASLIHLIGSEEKGELMLFRDLIPEATRVIYALQEESFLPYYSRSDPALVKSGLVSSVWPASMFKEADYLRARGIPRPKEMLVQERTPVTDSMALWSLPISDPRPSTLTLFKNLVSQDPGFADSLAPSIRARLSQRTTSPTIQFSESVSVGSPKDEAKVGKEHTKQNGISM